jgi:hypothetical protein
VTAVKPRFHCFNDLYIRIFPTMLRIRRSRMHYCCFPLLLLQLQVGVTWLHFVWHTRFPFLSAFFSASSLACCDVELER